MAKAISLFLFLSVHTLRAQPPPDSGLLLWNEFYQLQWADFEGMPDKASLADAGTVVQIKAKPFIVKKSIHYDVDAFFNRKKSWVRDKSDTLLAHERLHFDIAEVYARKIRRRIRGLSQQGVNDIKIYNAAIEKLLLESNEVDRQYDLETLHGALPRQQEEWTNRIKSSLRKLHKYKKTARIIGER